MCPMTPDYPLGNPLPAGSDGLLPLATGSVFGMGVNLFNNLWYAWELRSAGQRVCSYVHSNLY